jgi:dsRNA-specific ribonuclease
MHQVGDAVLDHLATSYLYKFLSDSTHEGVMHEARVRLVANQVIETSCACMLRLSAYC